MGAPKFAKEDMYEPIGDKLMTRTKFVTFESEPEEASMLILRGIFQKAFSAETTKSFNPDSELTLYEFISR